MFSVVMFSVNVKPDWFQNFVANLHFSPLSITIASIALFVSAVALYFLVDHFPNIIANIIAFSCLIAGGLSISAMHVGANYNQMPKRLQTTNQAKSIQNNFKTQMLNSGTFVLQWPQEYADPIKIARVNYANHKLHYQPLSSTGRAYLTVVKYIFKQKGLRNVHVTPYLDKTTATFDTMSNKKHVVYYVNNRKPKTGQTINKVLRY